MKSSRTRGNTNLGVSPCVPPEAAEAQSTSPPPRAAVPPGADSDEVLDHAPSCRPCSLPWSCSCQPRRGGRRSSPAWAPHTSSPHGTAKSCWPTPAALGVASRQCTTPTEYSAAAAPHTLLRCPPRRPILESQGLWNAAQGSWQRPVATPSVLPCKLTFGQTIEEGSTSNRLAESRRARFCLLVLRPRHAAILGTIR